ncbi:MAG: hypothetical protein KKB51_01295 [Candidatus Riflebacteria bacterium]|nr:hypothetical protein [Candidatus Riflebacteria bacterium]
MNIRQIAGMSPNYYEISREERNYAAIFFAALCKPGNAEKFLKYCGFESIIGPEFGIYFEYAYLRDMWNHIIGEEPRKNIIRNKLQINNIEKILSKTPIEINTIFGIGGKTSSAFIQNPGKWSILKYNQHFPDNDDFLKICMFKWSFNIKPDIVIHLDKDRSICIEAKYESREGSYPATDKEKGIFRSREIEYVGQMELQKYMMEELLGVKTDFMFLVFKKEKSATHKVISWAEAFGAIEMKDMPKFAIEMAKIISGEA